ncbi:hypothetical protein G8759_19725 [Spirosoma aureum]|uniref:YbhB/YbcL family Raf kinase inhibitor-like protein n=1 Tax=Spirosoma aureum TaxID=2692134 RepID=A0A6G9AQB8_9BACT|nr:hypothetical protein G8759_19725 [Spirosoma aureum]
MLTQIKALAVTMYAIDAPTGSGLWHWMVYTIPASTTSLESDAESLPKKQPAQRRWGQQNDTKLPGRYSVKGDRSSERYGKLDHSICR